MPLREVVNMVAVVVVDLLSLLVPVGLEVLRCLVVVAVVAVLDIKRQLFKRLLLGDYLAQ